MKNFYDFIINRGSTSDGHSLEKIKKLLEYFDNPQDKIKIIHVGGTNGKGSVSNFIANTLARKNRVGLFTSPYMTEINETIQINGDNISDEDFGNILDRLKEPLEELDNMGIHNSYFEVLTAVMYIYFYENNVDVAVVEVGLGGTLDSTNIIKHPIASVITTISMDHTDILGNSLEEIAQNKAGIIKEKAPVFLYPKDGSIKEIFYDKAKETSSEIYTFSKDEVVIESLSEGENIFSFRTYDHVRTKLIGLHQVYNASLALMVLDYFKDEFSLSRDDIYQGILTSRNPGRLEEISQNPKILVDGSHNREAIDSLLESIKTYKFDRLIVCFSVLKDKDYNYIINRISEVADEIVVTEIPDNNRAFEVGDLYEVVSKSSSNVKQFKSYKDAYDYSVKEASSNDLILWCGSLYLIGEILKYNKSLQN